MKQGSLKAGASNEHHLERLSVQAASHSGQWATSIVFAIPAADSKHSQVWCRPTTKELKTQTSEGRS